VPQLLSCSVGVLYTQLTGANHSRCRAWSTRGRSSRFPSAISVTSSPGVAAFVSLTMVVEPGGELVSWPRWSLLISSLRPMDRPVKTRGLVDDDDGGRTWRGGRRFTRAPGGFGGPAPPMALDFVDWHFGSSHPGREESSAREMTVVAGSDFASHVRTTSTWGALPSRVVWAGRRCSILPTSIR
jgi:hypothetical protein